MKFKEFFDYVVMNSGNHIIPEKSLELTKEQFMSVLHIAIGLYNKYTPLSRKFSINAGSRNYEFSGTEYREYLEWGIPLIPRSLSDVTPTSFPTLNVLSSLMRRVDPSLYGKDQFVWRYDAPYLRLDRIGEFEVHAVYNHPIIQEDESDIDSVILPSITSQDISFLDFITGRFMQIIGRSRGLFSQSDSPIIIDSATMISEGKAIEEKAREDIVENYDFYLGWR